MFKPKEMKNRSMAEAPIVYENIKPEDEHIPSVVVSQLAPHEFNGQEIENLEATGFKTIELLKVANKAADRPKYNLGILEAIPLPVVFESLGAEKTGEIAIGEQYFRFFGFEFKTLDNKWFNITANHGRSNAISLTKDLIAIRENLNPLDNEKSLFLASCKHLSSIELNIEHNNVVEKEREIAPGSVSQPVPPEAPKPPAKIDWKQLNDQLNAIPLDAVMEYLGANPNEDGHRGQWKVYRTGHNIQVTGNMWMNWNTNEGGHGGISLMTEYISIIENINTKDKEGWKYANNLAKKELIKEFGSDFDSSSIETGMPSLKEPFAMPHIIETKINDVRTYLNEKRGIPLWIVNKQIATGNLFAGCAYDWKPNNGKVPVNLKKPDKIKNADVWAIFLAINGNAAEMRAIERTDQFAKVLARGSDKSMGGFLIKNEKDCNEKTVTALEAAIDSLSYHAFYPGRVAMSVMGVNFGLAVSSAIQAIDSKYNFQLAFDNDLAGNEGTVNFKEHLIEEIGEEEYKELMDNNRIGYFDLGIRVLEETIKNNETYYFDVKNNDKGKEAVLMFREQLMKNFSKEIIKDWEKQGKIKYINVCPAFELIRDERLEARQVVDLLESGKPYYLRSVESDDEKPEVAQKRLRFENAVVELAQGKIEDWKAHGKMIFEKNPLAKDWNEFFLYKKNDPEFQNTLRVQEEQYGQYSSKKSETKKEPRMSM